MANDATASPADSKHAPVLMDVNVGEVKRKREVLESLANRDVSEYRCPKCGETYPDERLVRVHATRSKDEPHQSVNGFVSLDVEAVDSKGDVVGEIPPAGNLHKDGVMKMTTEDLPDTFDETEKVIILTACKNAYTEEYSELAKSVNKELRDRDMSEVKYSKVYRLVKDYLDKGTRRQRSKTSPEEKTFDELTEKQQAVLYAHVKNPDADMSDIAEMTGVNASYPKQVLDKYGRLTDEVEEYDEDTLREENEIIETMSQAKESTAEFEELTPKQQKIVDAFAKNPGVDNKTVSGGDEELKEAGLEPVGDFEGCSISYPTRIKSKFGDIIEQRKRHFGTEGEEEAAAPESRTTPAETWEELTENQQKVVEELLKEDNPTDPDSTRTEIAEEAGVHSTYVGDVLRKYGDLIENLAELEEEQEDVEVVADQPVTGTAAKPMSASPYDLETTEDVEEAAEEVEEAAEEVEEAAEEIEGPTITYNGEEYAVAELDSLYEERELSYRDLQDIAIDLGIQGNQSGDEIISAIKRVTGYTEGEVEEAAEELEEATEDVEEATEELEEAEEETVGWVSEETEEEAPEEAEAEESEEVTVPEGATVEIPVERVQQLFEQAEATRQMAARESELSTGDTSAHGRLAVAEVWQQKMAELLDEVKGTIGEEEAKHVVEDITSHAESVTGETVQTAEAQN